uniref:VPS9 domain-containing protein n=1 Tax=Pinguiococcus pyrenoidosus TaxID=172671 RepID=A0A7R9YBU0_9STRA
MGFSATDVQAAMRDLQAFQDESESSGAFAVPSGGVDGFLERVMEREPVADVFGSDVGEGSGGDILEELLNPTVNSRHNPLALPNDGMLGSSAFLRAQRKPRGGWLASPSRATDRSKLFGERSGQSVGSDSRERKLFSAGELQAGGAVPEESQSAASSRTALSDVNGMSYEEFIVRLLQPASSDLLDYVRNLINSILHAHAENDPSCEELRGTLTNFYGVMITSMASHRAWGSANPPVDEDGLLSARNWLEKFVMSKIGHICFAAAQETAQDDALLRKMEQLRLLTPEDLHVPEYVQNELSLELAAAELRKINGVVTPGEKIACVVQCATMIFSVLNLARKRGDTTSRPGADDFLPVFIYVVLQARVPKLQSNCAYIEAFHNPVNLMSKAGYCFVNLCSASAFIMDLDCTSIGMDPKAFDEKIAEAAAL